jgi:hypothetical protein
MDLYHSLVIGLLVLIAFYPILKDQATDRAERIRRQLQDQRDAINSTHAALREARGEVATRQRRAKEQKGFYGEDSERACNDNLKYLPGAIQHVEHLEGILERELAAAGVSGRPTDRLTPPRQPQPSTADTRQNKS